MERRSCDGVFRGEEEPAEGRWHGTKVFGTLCQGPKAQSLKFASKLVAGKGFRGESSRQLRVSQAIDRGFRFELKRRWKGLSQFWEFRMN